MFEQFENRNKKNDGKSEPLEEKENKESSDEYEESIDSSDEEMSILENFNADSAWDLLAKLNDCVQITLT